MKANPDKCHFLCSSNREVSLTIENQIIKNSKFEKLLGIKLDSKLNFNSHIHEICQKAEQKLNAISRIAPYMDFAKKRLIVNAFFFFLSIITKNHLLRIFYKKTGPSTYIIEILEHLL